MELAGEMDGVVQGDGLHINVAATVPALALPERLLKRLERELMKEKARQRAHKKTLVRRTRSIMSNVLAELSPKDRMEDAPSPAPQSELRAGAPRALLFPTSFPRTDSSATSLHSSCHTGIPLVSATSSATTSNSCPRHRPRCRPRCRPCCGSRCRPRCRPRCRLCYRFRARAEDSPFRSGTS